MGKKHHHRRHSSSYTSDPNFHATIQQFQMVSGPPGPVGPSGADGADGATGATGATGFTGPAGLPGGGQPVFESYTKLNAGDPADTGNNVEYITVGATIAMPTIDLTDGFYKKIVQLNGTNAINAFQSSGPYGGGVYDATRVGDYLYFVGDNESLGQNEFGASISASVGICRYNTSTGVWEAIGLNSMGFGATVQSVAYSEITGMVYFGGIRVQCTSDGLGGSGVVQHDPSTLEVTSIVQPDTSNVVMLGTFVNVYSLLATSTALHIVGNFTQCAYPSPVDCFGYANLDFTSMLIQGTPSPPFVNGTTYGSIVQHPTIPTSFLLGALTTAGGLNGIQVLDISASPYTLTNLFDTTTLDWSSGTVRGMLVVGSILYALSGNTPVVPYGQNIRYDFSSSTLSAWGTTALPSATTNSIHLLTYASSTNDIYVSIPNNGANFNSVLRYNIDSDTFFNERFTSLVPACLYWDSLSSTLYFGNIFYEDYVNNVGLGYQFIPSSVMAYVPANKVDIVFPDNTLVQLPTTIGANNTVRLYNNGSSASFLWSAAQGKWIMLDMSLQSTILTTA